MSHLNFLPPVGKQILSVVLQVSMMLFDVFNQSFSQSVYQSVSESVSQSSASRSVSQSAMRSVIQSICQAFCFSKNIWSLCLSAGLHFEGVKQIRIRTALILRYRLHNYLSLIAFNCSTFTKPTSSNSHFFRCQLKRSRLLQYHNLYVMIVLFALKQKNSAKHCFTWLIRQSWASLPKVQVLAKKETLTMIVVFIDMPSTDLMPFTDVTWRETVKFIYLWL